jgi:hypothetical protein
MIRATLTFGLLVTLASVGLGQAWADTYQAGLSAAKSRDWAKARAAFMEAAASRPEDQAKPTMLPGSVTEPIRWRGGAPYSPNFGAAYAAYKLGETLQNEERTAILQAAVTGFETLLAKQQNAPATFYFLNLAYGLLNQPDKQRALEQTLKATPLDWLVDTEIITPEEAAQVNDAMASFVRRASGSSTGNIKAGPDTTPSGTVAAELESGVSTLVGRVPVIPTKFALIIGNAESAMANGAQPFANNDAMLIRESLVQNAGYDDRNVDLVVNATAEQLRVSAQALADRMPEEATLFIFFSGTGVNIDGKDYFVGIDATMATDSSRMVAKSELFQMFISKGARIFFFSQANRPVDGGRYFGWESLLVGAIAESHGTMPNGQVLGSMSGDKIHGLYGRALSAVLHDLRTNTVPINEFGWLVFNKMRGGDSGLQGVGSRQVPTLPVLQNLTDKSPF